MEYKTYYELNKKIKEDPKLKTNAAKRQIARFIDLHDTNIEQRIEIIVEHFRTTVMDELGGQAKAMVITSSREAAVKFRQQFEAYVERKGYKDIHALVAFSGKVRIKDSETGEENEYTESGMSGFPENQLPDQFDSDQYQVLLAANKYQTGFDQPKLCAMYVLKKLKGVNAVQTLSRLNRTCEPYDKKVFILDFCNTYEEIRKAFEPYYTTTILANSVTPSTVYDLEARIDAYAVLDPNDIEEVYEILCSGQKAGAEQKQRLTYFFQKSKKQIEKQDLLVQREIVRDMKSFVRYYEFLIQVSCFEDTALHKKYKFITYLLSYIDLRNSGKGFNLEGKIQAENFSQKKGATHSSTGSGSDRIIPKPEVRLPQAEQYGLSPDREEKLSEIIEEINRRTGKNLDKDVSLKAVLQIRDLMAKSESLKTRAQNNTEQDFDLVLDDYVDDALIRGLEQNQEFYSLLLNDEDLKHSVLGVFSDDLYHELRDEKDRLY